MLKLDKVIFYLDKYFANKICPEKKIVTIFAKIITENSHNLPLPLKLPIDTSMKADGWLSA